MLNSGSEQMIIIAFEIDGFLHTSTVFYYCCNFLGFLSIPRPDCSHEESKQANELFGVVKCRVAAGRVTCTCGKCHNVLQLPRQLMEGVVS